LDPTPGETNIVPPLRLNLFFINLYGDNSQGMDFATKGRIMTLLCGIIPPKPRLNPHGQPRRGSGQIRPIELQLDMNLFLRLTCNPCHSTISYKLQVSCIPVNVCYLSKPQFDDSIGLQWLPCGFTR
jgi:hypothetical protein